jgi:hypothetical protein
MYPANFLARDSSSSQARRGLFPKYAAAETRANFSAQAAGI